MKRIIPLILAAILSIFLIFKLSYRTFAQDCEIGEVQATALDCDDNGSFMVEINFDYANVGTDGFHVQGNGNMYGNFEYSDLPIQVGPLEGDGTTAYEFAVIDNQFEGCSNWTEIDPVDCGGSGECYISELTIDDYPCEGGNYNVLLDFNYENVSEEGFRLYVNGDLFGEYSYSDLPLNIGPFVGDGETIYHFLVEDYLHESCASDANFGPIDCNGGGDCYISELTIDDYPCEDGQYNVLLDFDYQNVGSNGFKLFVNYDLFGEYYYEDLPLNIGPFIGDGESVYHFLVQDANHEDCASDANFGPIQCDTTGTCHIWDVNAEVLPCDESGNFNVQLNFNHINTGNEGFRVQGNGHNYGNFEYADLPIQLGPFEGDGVTGHEFVVIDNQYGDCSGSTAIDPVNCNGGGDCNIHDMTVEVNPCEEGNFTVNLNFEYEHVSDAGFNLYVNYELYGTYSYADLPINIGPLAGDGETAYHLLVRDVHFEDCAEDIVIDPVDCTGGECHIWDVEATVLPCNEEGEFNVLLNFEYENVGDDGFEVHGNGHNYGTFEYNDLPITLGPFIADGETEYEFGARDRQHEDCHSATSIEPFICDSVTLMTNMSMEVQNCNDKTYYLLVDFDMIEPGGESFTITGNGMEQQTFSYSDLPLLIGPLTNDEVSSYYFIVHDENGFGNWKRLFPFTCENLGFAERKSVSDQLSVFPNPSSGLVYFKSTGSETIEISIYDLTGNEIDKINLGEKSIQSLNFTDPGLYFYRASDGYSLVSGKFTIN